MCEGASCECAVVYRGGLHKNWCCGIITGVLSLLWICPRQSLGPPILPWFRTDEQPDHVSITMQRILNSLNGLLCTFPEHNSRNFKTGCTLTLQLVDAADYLFYPSFNFLICLLFYTILFYYFFFIPLFIWYVTPTWLLQNRVFSVFRRHRRLLCEHYSNTLLH